MPRNDSMTLDKIGLPEERLQLELATLTNPRQPKLATYELIPFSRTSTTPPVPQAQIPQTIAELGELTSFTYDLSAKRAFDLGIPVAGTASLGTERRVVVFEWTRFKAVSGTDGKTYNYGFALRFCLTVNKWDANAKLSLPFVSAQAQLGQVEARWVMQVRGLAGTRIDAVIVPPQELNVETFVIAKQSLEAAIQAVRDPSTTFVPGIVISVVDPASTDQEYWLASVRAFALTCIVRGRPRSEATTRLGTMDATATDVINDTYEYLGVGAVARPSDELRRRARQILREINADV